MKSLVKFSTDHGALWSALFGCAFYRAQLITLIFERSKLRLRAQIGALTRETTVPLACSGGEIPDPIAFVVPIRRLRDLLTSPRPESFDVMNRATIAFSIKLSRSPLLQASRSAERRILSDRTTAVPNPLDESEGELPLFSAGDAGSLAEALSHARTFSPTDKTFPFLQVVSVSNGTARGGSFETVSTMDIPRFTGLVMHLRVEDVTRAVVAIYQLGAFHLIQDKKSVTFRGAGAVLRVKNAKEAFVRINGMLGTFASPELASEISLRKLYRAALKAALTSSRLGIATNTRGIAPLRRIQVHANDADEVRVLAGEERIAVVRASDVEKAFQGLRDSATGRLSIKGPHIMVEYELDGALRRHVFVDADVGEDAPALEQPPLVRLADLRS